MLTSRQHRAAINAGYNCTSYSDFDEVQKEIAKGEAVNLYADQYSIEVLEAFGMGSFTNEQLRKIAGV